MFPTIVLLVNYIFQYQKDLIFILAFLIFLIIICVRVARADIKMDVGQDAETEEEETDPGIFCRNSPIRKMVVILRLDFFRSDKRPCQVQAR